MKLTEINVSFVSNDKSGVVAFVSIVLDGELVIHEIRVIRGERDMFVAMPDRANRVKCFRCRRRSPTTANYCQHCGDRLQHNMPIRYLSITNPISSEFREYVETAILDRVRALGSNPAPAAT